VVGGYTGPQSGDPGEPMHLDRMMTFVRAQLTDTSGEPSLVEYALPCVVAATAVAGGIRLGMRLSSRMVLRPAL
jgi:hypothetical protein